MPLHLRPYREGDTPALITLFRETIHSVNRRDYSPAQLAAWAPAEIDEAAWAARQAEHHTLLAEIDGALAGFAELTTEGHLHMLFVHKDHQGEGIASALLAAMEERAHTAGQSEITTDASLTAQPFFQRQGFRRLAEQEVERNGQTLRNCRMAKTLSIEEQEVSV